MPCLIFFELAKRASQLAASQRLVGKEDALGEIMKGGVIYGING